MTTEYKVPPAVRRRDADLRRKVALSCNILAMEGLGDVQFGHVSGRRPGEHAYWMKPRFVGMEEVRPEDLILMDLDGNQLLGSRPAHNERPIHAEVYRARPDVISVVHIHPPFATALAASGKPLRPVSHEACYFTPDVPRFEETSDLIVTREQGEAMARVLGQREACFLRYHGIVVVGTSVEEACIAALLLEKAARMQLLADLQGDYGWTPEAEARLKKEHIYHPAQFATLWEYHCRKLAAFRRFGATGAGPRELL